MSTIEKLGVRMSNPVPVTIDAASYAEYIALLHIQVEMLAKTVAILNLENPGGENERLAEVQNAVALIASSTRDALLEHLRLARDQGLRFAIAPPGGALHH
ncbi:MAG: hypothetical protein HZA64_07025 [Rhodocyclales bacterium]|nr:hypothetical protein [Rhodocyclales bacterium]